MSCTLQAQDATTAGLRGRLIDEGGVPVEGAELRLQPANDGKTGMLTAPVVVRTDRQGGFTLLGLEAGTYTVGMYLPGSPWLVGTVRLSVAFGAPAEVTLRLASRPAGLELRLDEVRLDEGSFATSSGEGVEIAPAQEIPVRDRQWEEVEAERSGAQDATLAGGGSAQDAAATEGEDTATTRAERESKSAATGLSVAGLPTIQNAQTLDGLSADQGFRGGPRGAAAGGPRLGSGFAQGAVRSLRGRGSTFSAQYGGTGAALAVISRRAESRLRGSVFFQARESGWAAANPFATAVRYHEGVVSQEIVKPADGVLQFGGAVGVPLRMPGVSRDWRAGAFGAVEGQTRAQTLVSTPSTAQFFELTPTQTALLGTRGVSAGATRAALTYLGGLTGEAVTHTPRVLGFLRVNVAPRPGDQFSMSAQVQRQSAPVTGGGQIAEGVFDRSLLDLARSEVQVEAYTGQWRHSFGQRAANNLRAQMAHDIEFETPQAPSANEPAIGPGGFVPQVSIQPEGFRYGTPASLGRVAYPDEHRVEVADSFEVRWGRHLVTVGGDWSRLHDRVLAATNLEGSFLYDSASTNGHAGGLVDWITDYTFNVHAYPNGGCPSIYAPVHDFCFRSYSQSFTGGATAFVTHEVSGFLEDSWRARPDLVVTFGARYDYLLLPLPQTPNAVLDAAMAAVNGPAAGATASFPEDRNNVGPRISVAWAPRKRPHGHVVTAEIAYGVFYGRLPGATINAALSETALPSSTESIRITPTTETACPQVANQGFGYPCAFLSAPVGAVARTSSAVLFAGRFRLPAMQRGSFALERAFGRRVFLRGAYATAWTTQLPESVDMNIAPATGMANFLLQGGSGYAGLRAGETFAVPLYTARRTPLFGPVTALVSNANATYHSAEAEVRLQDWHGLAVRGSYTFARAIDYGPQSSPTPRQDGQFDPFADGYDKGLSSLQFAHHFAGDLVWQPRVTGGPPVLRALLSDWRFAAIGTAGSGAPYSYVIFGGTRLTGGHESVNGSGGATYLPTVGRNTLRLPPRGRFDLRVARDIPLGPRLRLGLQADAFNVLNTVNVSRVETRAFLPGAPVGGLTPLIFQDAASIAAEGLSTPAFGTALSSTSGLSRERQVELGARLSF